MAFFFQGKDVYTTAAISIKLIDETIKDRRAEAIYFAIKYNNPIPDALIAVAMSGLGAELPKIMKYAEETYVDGLPEGTTASSVQDVAEVQRALKQYFGSDASLSWVKLSPINAYFYGSYYLTTYHGMDYDTKIIPDANTHVEGWQYTSAHYSGNALYVLLVELPPLIPLPEDDPFIPQQKEYITTRPVTEPWYFGEYTNIKGYDEEENPIYGTFPFVYLQSSGVIPSLNANIGGNVGNKMLPIVCVRKNSINIDRDGNRESEEYITTEKIMKLSYSSLSAFTDNLESSPDIEKVLAAFSNFSVNIYTDLQISRAYLYNFFNTIRYISSVAERSQKVIYMDPISDGEISYPSSIYGVYRYDVIEDGFHMVLNYEYIRVTTHSGTIAAVGEYATQWGGGTSAPYAVSAFYYPNASESNAVYTPWVINNGFFIIQKQISANTYSEILVSQLHKVSLIQGKKYVGNAITVISYDEEEQANFTIPVSYGVLDDNNISNTEAENFLYDCMHMVIYAETKTSLKWYQTSGFGKFVGFVLKVVAIVLAAPTGGASLSLTYVAQVAAVAAASYILMKYAVPYITKRWGATAGMIAAVVGSIGISMAGGGFSTFSLSISTAKDMLLIVNALANSINISTSLEMEEFKESKEVTDNHLNTLQEQVDEIADLLNTNSSLDPLSIVRMQLFPFAESAEEFFNRTLMQNPGIESLSDIDRYVDNRLELPENITTLPYRKENSIETAKLLV